MVSERPLSTRAGSSLYMAGIVLMLMVLCPAGNTFAAPTGTASDANPAKGALVGVPLNF